MAKNIFFFGAGASFGAEENKKYVPQIADKLYDALKKFAVDTWGELPKKYDEIFKYDFEKGMLQVENDLPYMVSYLQRAMAAYFYQFRFTENNLYYKIAKGIRNKNWDGAFITLNYDLIIGMALGSVGFNVYSNVNNIESDSAIDRNLIEVCYPHGCCHIFDDSVFINSNNVIIDPMRIKTGGDIKIIQDNGYFNEKILNNAIPPVMCYFEPNKEVTAGYEFIKSQRRRYNFLINNAENICIIGIKIREHDNHIWDVLRNTNARIIYCSGISEQDVFNEWENKYRKNKKDIFLEGYFKDEFENICRLMEVDLI